MRIAAVAACLGLTGCAYLGSARDLDPAALERDADWVAVRRVEPQLQSGRSDCGAAALATVLNYWGVPVTVADVAEALPQAPDGGIRAGDLRDFARRHGLKAYLFHGEISDLERELARNRPVLVGLVKPYVTGRLSHYEVVVGLRRSDKTVASIDPAHGWRENSLAGFISEWAPAGRLTLVIFKPRKGDPS